MLSYGNSTFNYNARGSLTFKAENDDTTFYNYDMLGNLISVTLPNGDFIEYLIDAQNRRVGKKVNGVIEKQWIYQDQLNPVAEFDGSGNLIARFVYGDKGHPEESGQVVPAYMIKAGVVYRYVTDHLGSVRLVVNAQTGEVVQRLEYNEFGNVLLNTAPDFQLTINAAQVAGFSYNDSYKIFEAGLYLDIFMHGSLAYHYVPGYENQSEFLISNLLNEAVITAFYGSWDKAMSLLGKALHILQDKWAHYVPMRDECTGKIPNEDDPNVYQNEYINAYNESIMLLQQFNMLLSAMLNDVDSISY